MKRKSVWIPVVLLVLAGIILANFYFFIRHEPEFYRRAAIPPGPERLRDSQSLNDTLLRFIHQVNNETQWEAYFTDQQLNSWLAEEFLRSDWHKLLPKDVSEPRVVFQKDTVLLAFRYGDGEFSSVVSLEARLWISPSETNTLVVEVLDLRAGAMPLSTKMIQDRFNEAAEEHNLDVQWYRQGRNPTAVIRFEKDKREPSFELVHLDVGDGSFHIKAKVRNPEYQTVERAPLPRERAN